MEWSPILEFPGYSVSDTGCVFNETYRRTLVPTANQFGVAQVGLMRDRVQYKRGVALLVANAFLDPPPSGSFNTPINLNGDRLYNALDNLVWRPRWFAIKYHRQFHEPLRGFREPIIEVKTGEQFPTSWEAATKYGLLDFEIMLAAMNRTYVWPTYQEYRLIQ